MISRTSLPVPWLRLGRIERYVLVQQARSLGVALGVIAALIMLIDFVEISRGVGSDVDLSGVRILGLMLLNRNQAERYLLASNHDFLLEATDLEERLSEAAANIASSAGNTPELRLRADRQTHYEKVAQVMSAASRHGLTRLGFVTDPSEVPAR